MGVINKETKSKLQEQIGHYESGSPTSPGQTCLSTDGEKKLYQGIESYRQLYEAKVAAYSVKNKKEGKSSKDFMFFRKQFIEYLETYNSNTKCSLNELTRFKHPEKALLSLKDLLGPKGVELYHLALEEEFNSEEYRSALIKKSTSHFEGAQWIKRPVIIIAGPSGCGKSFAAQSASKYASRFLSTIEGDSKGNNIITADAGIAREVSQMRKLVIQVANSQGYSGVIDLHAQSTILQKVKPRVQEAAFASPGVGVVIPETFSNWFNVFSPIRNLMKLIDGLKQTRQIFVRVEGEELTHFKKTVAFMGSRRAWKTSGFENPCDWNLNQTGLTESKAYSSEGFFFGNKGSEYAENWYKTYSKDKLNMVIKNDLILLKRTEAPPIPWLPAEQGDKGAQLFSNSTYIEWLNAYIKWIKESKEKKSEFPDLERYCKIDNGINGIKIKTSAQIDYIIARKELIQGIQALKKLMDNKGSKILNKIERLTSFIQQLPEELGDSAAINHLKEYVTGFISIVEAKKEGNWKSLFFSKTLRTLNKIYMALDNASRMTEFNLNASKIYKKDLVNMKSDKPDPGNFNKLV